MKNFDHFPVDYLSDGSQKIQVNTKIYSMETISSTCYKYLDKYFVNQQIDANSDVIYIFFKTKDGSNLDSNLAMQFGNDLIDNQVRFNVNKEFGYIRDKIVEQAFKPVGGI